MSVAVGERKSIQQPLIFLKLQSEFAFQFKLQQNLQIKLISVGSIQVC